MLMQCDLLTKIFFELILMTLRYVYQKLFYFSKSESLMNFQHLQTIIKRLFLSIQLPNEILIFRSLCTWCFHRKNLLPSEVKESHFFQSAQYGFTLFLQKLHPFFLLSKQQRQNSHQTCLLGQLNSFFPPRSLHFLFSSHGRSKKKSQLTLTSSQNICLFAANNVY